MDDRREVALGVLAAGALLLVAGVVWLSAGGDDSTKSAEPATTPVTTSSTTTSSTTTSSTTTATSTSTSTTTSSTTTITTVPPETPEEFLALLNAAFSGGDATTLADRLNQATIDIYGVEACTAYLHAILAADQSEFTMRDVVGVGLWDYVIDDITTPISDATSVEVSRDIGDQTVVQELHWQLVEGRYTWFTDCGDPLSG